MYTWVVMLLLTVGSWLVTRRLADSDQPRSRWQNALEMVVETIRGQIREMCPQGGDTYLPFIGTLFLFIAGVEPAGRCAGLACADRIALDHGGAGDFRRRGGAGVRSPEPGRDGVFPALPAARRSSCCRFTC